MPSGSCDIRVIPGNISHQFLQLVYIKNDEQSIRPVLKCSSEFCTEEIQVGDVCQAIFDTSDEEQEKIKNTLIMIDFKNGNIYHFLNHLSQALDKDQVIKKRSEMAKEMFNSMINECKERRKRKKND